MIRLHIAEYDDHTKGILDGKRVKALHILTRSWRPILAIPFKWRGING